MAHFANDGNFLLFSILIVYFSKLPDVSLAFLGVNAIIYNVLYGAISLPIGRIADRINRDAALITLGIGLEAAAASIFGVVFLYPGAYLPLVLLGSVALGAGQAFYHPLGATVLSFSYKKDKLGTFLGINGGAGSVGRALVPSLITFFIIELGTFAGVEVLAVYTWILALAVYFGLRGFRRIYKEPIVKHAKIPTPKEVRSTLYRVVAPVFVKGAFLMGSVTFVAAYLDHITGSAELTGVILTLSFIPAIAGQPFFGYMTSKKGGKYTISLTSVITLFAFLAFLSTSNIILLTLLYAIIAFVLFNGFSVLLDYTYQLVPQKYYSRAYGMVWGVGNILGGAFGVGLMTFFLTFTTITISMYYMAAVLVVSILFIPLLPRETNK